MAGNYWFKHEAGNKFTPVKVGTIGGRIASGKFKPGEFPQIVIAPGDGIGPLKWYECTGNPINSADWRGHDLFLGKEMTHGHTLEVGDVDGDGHLDIFAAELAKWTEKQTNPNNPNAKSWIFFGTGRGEFRRLEFTNGHIGTRAIWTATAISISGTNPKRETPGLYLPTVHQPFNRRAVVPGEAVHHTECLSAKHRTRRSDSPALHCGTMLMDESSMLVATPPGGFGMRIQIDEVPRHRLVRPICAG